MKRFVLAPAAAQDLNDIWDYVAEDSLDGADRLIKKLIRVDAGFGADPGRGPSAEGFGGRPATALLARWKLPGPLCSRKLGSEIMGDETTYSVLPSGHSRNIQGSSRPYTSTPTGFYLYGLQPGLLHRRAWLCWAR